MQNCIKNDNEHHISKNRALKSINNDESEHKNDTLSHLIARVIRHPLSHPTSSHHLSFVIRLIAGI